MNNLGANEKEKLCPIALGCEQLGGTDWGVVDLPLGF